MRTYVSRTIFQHRESITQKTGCRPNYSVRTCHEPFSNHGGMFNKVSFEYVSCLYSDQANGRRSSFPEACVTHWPRIFIDRCIALQRHMNSPRASTGQLCPGRAISVHYCSTQCYYVTPTEGRATNAETVIYPPGQSFNETALFLHTWERSASVFNARVFQGLVIFCYT